MKVITTEELLAQMTYDAERCTRRIEKILLKPTKNSAKNLKNWQFFQAICLATIEKLERLIELEKLQNGL